MADSMKFCGKFRAKLMCYKVHLKVAIAGFSAAATAKEFKLV